MTDQSFLTKKCLKICFQEYESGFSLWSVNLVFALIGVHQAQFSAVPAPNASAGYPYW